LSATCLLCGATDAFQLTERRNVPVLQNQIVADPTTARQVQRGEVAFSFCPHCGLVFNSAAGMRRLPYSAEYDNSQTHSRVYRSHLENLAEYLCATYELKNKTILEIGCGKGALLRRLCIGGRNRGYGFDPSYVDPFEAENGAARFFREFYDGQLIGSPIDLVVCQHVLDHLVDPLAMLAQIRRVTSETSEAAVFCEVPDVAWIFQNVSFWDLCYERCLYFFPETLAWTFEKTGFKVAQTAPKFQGQYIWLEAKPAERSDRTLELPPRVEERRQQVEEFAHSAERKMADCLARIRSFHAGGGCAVWGAATKGAMLLNLLDPDCQMVRAVVDINPGKQGRFVPGTGHPIVSPVSLREDPVAGILLMNPNYFDECLELLTQLGISARLECA
jgi:SAM-dependent methyltransferase